MYNSFQAGNCVGISTHHHNCPNDIVEGEGIISFQKEGNNSVAVLDGAFEYRQRGIQGFSDSIRFEVAEIIPSNVNLSSLLMCRDLSILHDGKWSHFATRVHVLSNFDIGLTAEDIQRYLTIFRKSQPNAEDIVFIEHVRKRAELHLLEQKEKILQKRNKLLGINGSTTLF